MTYALWIVQGLLALLFLFTGGPFAAYGANYDRLVEIKTAYDPTNFFRHNQNIRPKGQAA